MPDAQKVPAGWYDDPENADQRRYWDGTSWTDDRARKALPAPSAGGAETEQRMWVLLAGGGLASIVGALLPWAVVRSGFGQASMAGIEGDGQVTAVAGLVAALIAFAAWRGRSNTGQAVLAVVAGVVILGVGGWHTAGDGVASVASEGVDVGAGLWLTLLAGAVVVVSAWMLRTELQDAG